MPRGDKSSYTDKQKRQAAKIEQSEKDQGRSTKVAERIAWATVNKQDGGGKKNPATGKTTKKPTKKAAGKVAKRPAAKKTSGPARKTTSRKAARKRD